MYWRVNPEGNGVKLVPYVNKVSAPNNFQKFLAVVFKKKKLFKLIKTTVKVD